jgi:hypothetical protein
MSGTQLERVAIEVADIETVAADLERALGIELRVLDVDQLGIRAAVGNQGLELVQRKVPEPRVARYWRPPLVALCIRVDDIAASEQRMAEAGFKLTQRVEAPALTELLYGDFHGLALVLYAHAGEFADSTGGGGSTVTWYDDDGSPEAEPPP